jgi:protein involved in polysaccharide export with SLBB domain
MKLPCLSTLLSRRVRAITRPALALRWTAACAAALLLLGAAPARAAEPVATAASASAAGGSGTAAAPRMRAPIPLVAAAPVVFGSQIFGGRFAQQSFTGFNPEHRIAPGDRIALRLWGAFTLEATQAVDAQGNIFLPNIGPVKVQGVRNAELNDLVQSQVKRVYRANVQSYANLEAAQPVKVYVTGFVRQPGLYNGLSSDSVIHYLDQAGGIDPERGSYLAVDVLRHGQLKSRFDLYRFLLEGRMESLQLQDGDTVFVGLRQASVRVAGEVTNPYLFEIRGTAVPAADLLGLAQPRPSATHLAIVRQVGPERRSEYHPLAQLAGVMVASGDEVTVTADKVSGTLQIRLEGAQRGERTAILPYGATLRDALARINPAPQAQLPALQLFRKSIAARQREMLALSLDKLETQALTARSATNEEAQLRTREAELVLQFTSRARSIEPKGQLVIPDLATAGDTLLEDGDTLFIPEQSSQVTLHGEVLFPAAIHHDEKRTAGEYIDMAGGYTQNADTSRVLQIKRNGTVVEAQAKTRLAPGEELMVLPKADTKSIEVTRGITQILYQIAVVAKIALGF